MLAHMLNVQSRGPSAMRGNGTVGRYRELATVPFETRRSSFPLKPNTGDIRRHREAAGRRQRGNVREEPAHVVHHGSGEWSASDDGGQHTLDCISNPPPGQNTRTQYLDRIPLNKRPPMQSLGPPSPLRIHLRGHKPSGHNAWTKALPTQRHICSLALSFV